MLAPEVIAFARRALPPAPARVLEVGAGGGELAEVLREDGFEVVAIDPAAESPGVEPIALAQLTAPPNSFDAAIAVLSLHHVDPLGESCRRLGEVVRPGGALVVDEFDVAAFDEGAARWWLARRDDPGHDHEDNPASLVADLRDHIHPLSRVREALGEWFVLEGVERGPYLYRWDMPPGFREAEEALIADGRLPATGARFVGIPK